MRYCFDLDGTLCTKTYGSYSEAAPYTKRIEVVRKLHSQGHWIIIDTARGSKTGIDWYELTKKQLEEWGVPYHELRVGKKPEADFYIDDKSITDLIFFDSC